MLKHTLNCLAIGLLLTLLVPNSALAGELYKCKGKNGETEFSDQPCPDAEVLPLRETPTYSAPTAPQLPVSGQEPAKKKDISYQIQLLEPAAEAVIRDNEGKVSVSVSVQPRLADEHQVRLLLDGSPVGDVGRSTSWSLDDVERGEHSVVVEVVHADTGKVVSRSQTGRFMLFRTSANQTPNGAGNLQLVRGPNGYVQQVQWPTQGGTAQPGDPAPSTPTKPTKPTGSGPKK